MFRPAVARFSTDASPEEVLRLAEAGLVRDAYRHGDPQLQSAVDARGWPWRVLTMDRGVDRKVFSPKGCLFALIPDLIVLLVPGIARHQADGVPGIDLSRQTCGALPMAAITVATLRTFAGRNRVADQSSAVARMPEGGRRP